MLHLIFILYSFSLYDGQSAVIQNIQAFAIVQMPIMIKPAPATQERYKDQW
jgi:hypothetical protein